MGSFSSQVIEPLAASTSNIHWTDAMIDENGRISWRTSLASGNVFYFKRIGEQAFGFHQALFLYI